MNRKIKEVIDEQYKKIYSSLDVKWQKEFKIKIEEMYASGLANSAISQSILTNYAVKLVKDTNEKIKVLLIDSQKKFNFIMSNNDIETYINKSIANSNNYLEKKQKELIEYFDKRKIKFLETYKIHFTTAKRNSKSQLEQIKIELLLMNESKVNKNKSLSKGDIIGITSIVVAIIIAILNFLFT